MSHRIVLRNTASNVFAQVMNIVTAMFLTPFLVYRLGQDLYGLWILVASLVGYFGLTDIGLRTAVGRFVALHLARDEYEDISKLATTALGLLFVSALVVVFLSMGCSTLFHLFFKVEAEHMSAARLLVLIMGLSFAVKLPMEVFDGILVGHARYDLNNAVEVGAALVRTGLCVVLLLRGFSVVALAVSAVIVHVLSGGAKLAIASRICPSLRIAPHHWTPGIIRELYGFGVWSFVVFLASQLSLHAGPIVLGATVGMSAVAIYSIASRLVRYATRGGAAFTGVLMPMMAAYHSTSNLVQEQRVLQWSISISLTYAGFVAAVFLVFGDSLIRAWVGPGFELSGPVLGMMTVPMIGWVLQGNFFVQAFGKGRHRFLSIVFMIDAVANVALSVVLARRWGVAGVPVAILCTSCITMFFVTPTYVFKLLSIRQPLFWKKVLGPGVVGALSAAGMLMLFRYLYAPTRLLNIALAVGGIGGVYFLCVYYLLIARSRHRPGAEIS